MVAIDDIVEQVRAERGWSASTAEDHRRAYIAFLSDTDARRRPTDAVDAIWHAHILWTRRYRQDCEALVGHFIDHEPDPLVPGRCTSPEQPDDIEASGARCTAPEEEPPPTGSARCTPSPEPEQSDDMVVSRANCTAPLKPRPKPLPPPESERQRAASCTPSEPVPPDTGGDPAAFRTAYAIGS